VAIFAPAVEAWSALLAKYAPDLSQDFLKKWIEVESNGNLCSWTTLRESGIFQLMIGDNQRVAGTTEALLRAACIANSQKKARTPTQAELEEQVRSGIAYVRWCIDQARKHLAAVGAKWPESSTDFGKMVKFEHVLPGRISTWLKNATAGLGRPPTSWAEIVPYASSAGIPANWVDNADRVGSYWTGVQIPVLLLAATAVAAFVYYLRRYR
jgi:hypothetical protein